MKTCKYSTPRLIRALRIGTALGAAVLTVSALQAEPSGQSLNSPPAVSAEPSVNISHRAKEFLEDAAQANQMEIALADVAAEKSQNTSVKGLAQTLRADHEQNLGQLQSLAKVYGVTLDDSVSWFNQRIVNHMQKAKDADFDKEYTKMMVKDHVACIKNFDKAVADIKEPDVRRYADNTLPTLRMHLRHSEEVARSVGLDEATIASILKGLPTEETERGVTLNQ